MKRAIVTGGTSNHTAAIGVLAMNIRDVCPDLADEMIVFHDEHFKPESMRLISSIYPVKFILYKSPFLQISDFSPHIMRYFSTMVFCKYECFRLLDEYDQVIWIDYDMVINESISDLHSMNNSYVKFPPGGILIKQFNDNVYNKLELIRDIDLLYGKSISCGIFILDRRMMKYKEVYRECIEWTAKLSDALYLPEQAIISISFQRHDIEIEYLDEDLYECLPSRESIVQDAKVIHSVGRPKFWEGLHNREWDRRYNQWMKMGGEKIKNEHYRIKHFMKQITPPCLAEFRSNEKFTKIFKNIR